MNHSIANQSHSIADHSHSVTDRSLSISDQSLAYLKSEAFVFDVWVLPTARPRPSFLDLYQPMCHGATSTSSMARRSAPGIGDG